MSKDNETIPSHVAPKPAAKCWRCGNPMAENRPFCPASEISAPCNASGEHPPVPPKHRPVASAASTTRQTAKQQFAELLVEDAAPLERLRLFCSLAMNGQDWLDVEPFFDALETTASATPQKLLKLAERAARGSLNPNEVTDAAAKLGAELLRRPDGGKQT